MSRWDKRIHIDLNKLSSSCSLQQQASARLYGARQQATKFQAYAGANALTQSSSIVVVANLVTSCKMILKSDWSFLSYKMVNPLFLCDSGYPLSWLFILSLSGIITSLRYIPYRLETHRLTYTYIHLTAHRCCPWLYFVNWSSLAYLGACAPLHPVHCSG